MTFLQAPPTCYTHTRQSHFLCCSFISRLRLHEGKVIKDRRHHLRTYPNCFVAKELIDWLIEHKEASDRDTAIKIMQKLLDQSIVHHERTTAHSHWTAKPRSS
uniref:DEP domain-containing protein n=1 Tax=Poecilia mexicana TaxID=48701 RepID=A0A3B3WVI9_9TELE